MTLIQLILSHSSVTIQRTTDLPDDGVKKCSLTVVSCAFASPKSAYCWCPRTNQQQYEQLHVVLNHAE
jgi:hypothetical protein